MKKAINQFKRFMSNSFDWPQVYSPEFIKDIAGGFLLGLMMLLLMFIAAILN